MLLPIAVSLWLCYFNFADHGSHGLLKRCKANTDSHSVTFGFQNIPFLLKEAKKKFEMFFLPDSTMLFKKLDMTIFK